MGNDAQIEIVTDGAVFTTTIKDHVPGTVQGTASDPDVRFRVGIADFGRLYSSEDMIATAKQLKNENKLSVEILKSEIVLATKGYAALYDEFK